MDGLLESKLRIYSIGKVVEPKLLGSNQIVVRATEVHPFHDGELKSDPGVVQAEGEDSTGKKYVKEIDTDISIIAKWFPLGAGNRTSAPDVRRNERVLIWQYEQQDEYFWTSLDLDLGYRRLETVIHRWSNTKDESVSELTDDNSWWLEVSTHKKTITLKTNNSDGEQYTYGFQINAKEGRVFLTDNLDNSFLLDSKNRILELENTDGSLLSINKKAILIKAIDSVTVDTKDFTVKSKNSTINGSSNVTLSGGKVDVKGTKFTVAPATEFTGSSVKHKGFKIDKTHKHTPPGGPVSP